MVLASRIIQHSVDAGQSHDPDDGLLTADGLYAAQDDAEHGPRGSEGAPATAAKEHDAGNARHGPGHGESLFRQRIRQKEEMTLLGI